MTHELKIWPGHYRRVREGTKTFEIRVNDRFYQKGDTVRLKAFDPERGYLGDPQRPAEDYLNWPDLTFVIGDVYPIDGNQVVFSLLKI